jgi:hypothetical protein
MLTLNTVDPINYYDRVCDLIADEDESFLEALTPGAVNELYKVNAQLPEKINFLEFAIENSSWKIVSSLLKTNIYKLTDLTHNAYNVIMKLDVSAHVNFINFLYDNKIPWFSIIAQENKYDIFFDAAQYGHLIDLQKTIPNIDLPEEVIQDLFTHAFLGSADDRKNERLSVLQFLYDYYAEKITIGKAYLNHKELLRWNPRAHHYYLSDLDKEFLLDTERPVDFIQNKGELLLSILDKTPPMALDINQQVFSHTVREILQNALEINPNKHSTEQCNDILDIRHKVLIKLLEKNNYYLLDAFVSCGFADAKRVSIDEDCCILIYNADYSIRELFLRRLEWNHTLYDINQRYSQVNLSYRQIEDYGFQLAYFYANQFLKKISDNSLNSKESMTTLIQENIHIQNLKIKEKLGKNLIWKHHIFEGLERAHDTMIENCALVETWIEQDKTQDTNIDLVIRETLLSKLFTDNNDEFSLCNLIADDISIIIEHIEKTESFDSIKSECMNFWMAEEPKDPSSSNLSPAAEIIIQRLEIVFSDIKSFMKMHYSAKEENLILYGWLSEKAIPEQSSIFSGETIKTYINTFR